jgi:hypothetical protein
MKGSAFDAPQTKRAYTYAEQPGNVIASKLGLACVSASKQPAGDSIDFGLSLLKELQDKGFGVFDAGAEYYAPAAPQAVQDDKVNESLAEDIEAMDTRYRGTPSYEHDAYYMRTSIAKMIRNTYALYAAPQAVPAHLEEQPDGSVVDTRSEPQAVPEYVQRVVIPFESSLPYERNTA